MDKLTSTIGITEETFSRLARLYRRRWQINLCAARPDGEIVFGDPGTKEKDPAAGNAIRRHATAEALRWGEPTVVSYSQQRLLWAVPLMVNAELRGGLVAGTSERRVFPSDAGTAGLDIRQACKDLLRFAEEANLTNGALLEARRQVYLRERKRAEAIHDLKSRYFYSIREVYLKEEPGLIAAMRKGNRGEARGILNRILVAIYHLGGENLNLIKSFLMELVVTMCRTAVESGGNPQELLGVNSVYLSELWQINSEEDLSHWLTQRLELIMDSIHHHRHRPSTALLHTAMKYLAEHFQEEITRDDVARVASLSPSHFSRLINRELGRSFSDLLNQLRVDRAAELLGYTDKGLLQIAMEVGFSDQSYFTKVFRRHTHLTPRQYRHKQQEDE
jgi:AraC-like DNA-binding protein